MGGGGLGLELLTGRWGGGSIKEATMGKIIPAVCHGGGDGGSRRGEGETVKMETRGL